MGEVFHSIDAIFVTDENVTPQTPPPPTDYTENGTDLFGIHAFGNFKPEMSYHPKFQLSSMLSWWDGFWWGDII